MAHPETRPPSESLTSSERGKATFQIMSDFFAGERKLESYLDGLHSWRVGDHYPTNLGSPRGAVRHEFDGMTLLVQTGVHYTGPDTDNLSSLERTLKVHIIDDVLNNSNRATTNHTVIGLNSGYLARIRSNDVVEHTDGKVRVFQNGKPLELDETSPETYEKIRKWLWPVISTGAVVLDEDADAATDIQLGVTEYPGSDVRLLEIPGR